MNQNLAKTHNYKGGNTALFTDGVVIYVNKISSYSKVAGIKGLLLQKSITFLSAPNE